MHQSYSIQSSFTQKVRLQQIRSLTEDIRFYYKRLRNNKDELEPRRKSKVVLHFTCEPHVVSKNTCLFPFIHTFQVANIYFDASLQCGDHCYVGLPFVLKCKRVFFLFFVTVACASHKHIFLNCKYLSPAVESKPHGLALQEDIWDSDVDLHQKLLRRWKELREHTGHK